MGFGITSVILFINSSFAREIDSYLKRKNFKLRKWSSRGNYKERFINNIFLDNEFQELPFFFRFLKVGNDLIIRSKDRYLRELGILNKMINQNQQIMKAVIDV
jgi:hypothetical protein